MIITIHRGTREIGGTCIEVCSGSTRLVLDAGMPLVDSNRQPFDSQRALRMSREELLAEGVIPKVPGLFADDAQPPDAILLSHAHLDHFGLLHHSNPEVPIFTTKGTSKMILAGSVFGGRPRIDRKRHRAVKPGVPFRVGEVQVTPISVDHSAFGSVAFLMESGGKSLLYSGDLRRHGRKPGMMKALVEKIGPMGIDVLLIEGTHFGREEVQHRTEYELEEEVVKHIHSAPSLVLAAFSPQDVDRLVTVYRAARRSGRTFVADVYAAFILHLITNEAKVPGPTRDSGIRVYFNQAFSRRGIERITKLFESDRIHLAEVLADPGKHVMVFRPSMTTPDFGDTLPQKSRILYGYWHGYLKRPEWVEFRQKVKDCGGDFIEAHVSGHIYVEDLIKLVTALNAKAVIPVHTFEPQMFREHFPNTVLLQDGQPYAIS